MERRSANLNFSIRFPARLLHKLLEAVARRAYLAGFGDGKQGEKADADRVSIDPAQLRKFQ